MHFHTHTHAPTPSFSFSCIPMQMFWDFWVQAETLTNILQWNHYGAKTPDPDYSTVIYCCCVMATGVTSLVYSPGFSLQVELSLDAWSVFSTIHCSFSPWLRSMVRMLVRLYSPVELSRWVSSLLEVFTRGCPPIFQWIWPFGYPPLALHWYTPNLSSHPEPIGAWSSTWYIQTL